jgi:hypothetical protein
MPDCVLDATVVAFSNGDIAGRRPGNALDRRLAALEQIAAGVRRLRYNPKLLHEYQELIKEYRNDVIETLFNLLDDTRRAILVRRNSLSRQDHAKATESCGWPSHDQHLLAAALNGVDPVIVVTEEHHSQCANAILKHFAVHIEYLG